MKIRHRITAVLSGKLHIDELDKAERSFISKYIFIEATKILQVRTKEERIKLLNNVPKLLQPIIKNEVQKKWMTCRSSHYLL